MGLSDEQQPQETEEETLFVAHLTSHQGAILGYLNSLLPGSPDVADIAQRTSIVLWTKRHEFQEGTNFKAWAFSVANWEARAWMTKTKRKSWLIFDEELVEKITTRSLILGDQAPEARTLVVLDQTAFESVHGNGLPIDGTFASGRLSNGGESIKLDDTDGSTIHDFEYDNNLPWPTSSAGGNFSLVLINPASNPNPNDPQNWRPSFSIGGNPGEPLTTTTFAGNPDDDLDRDGVSALVEHALGTSDTLSNESPIILTETTFSFSRNLAADDVQISVETSTDLVNWQENTVLINQTHNNNGTLTET
ncbi:MAG: sigma factor [Akkermansiaceae bacterium]